MNGSCLKKKKKVTCIQKPLPPAETKSAVKKLFFFLVQSVTMTTLPTVPSPAVHSNTESPHSLLTSLNR